MNIENHTNESDALAALLEQSGRYRVLRAVPPPFTNMPPDGCPPDAKCVALVDIESSGLDPANDEMIELAIMLLFVSANGELLSHFGPVSWLQQPSRPLGSQIIQITGLTDSDLAGKSINDAMAIQLLDRADLLVAHNARFDAAWIERRFPPVAERAWACSCSEIPWLQLGFEGRAQNHLLGQHGWFSSAHRAAADVWSLFHLLQEKRHDPGSTIERTHLQRLLKASSTSSVLVEAVNAPYSAKDRFKARQYRWNPDRKIWFKEMGNDDLAAERSWFRSNELPPFRTVTITACERHRSGV